MKKKTSTPSPTLGAANVPRIPEGRVIDEYPVANLTHAPWNPRTPAELKADHPEMSKLVESVRALGVVQPVAVWVHGDEQLCIAGNRRLEAAKIVGLGTIPAIVYDADCAHGALDEATARAITRAENEVRFGVSPLLDAKLIGELRDKGHTLEEISAVLGAPRRTVCRRVKLLDLSPETLEFFANRTYEVSALEYLADKSRGDAKLQSSILSGISYRNHVTFDNVHYAYSAATTELNFESYVFTGPGGEARKAKCAVCGMCTGNQPDLFGETDDETENRCLVPKCYHMLQKEADADILTAAIEAVGGSAADAENIKRFYEWEFNEKTKGFKRKKGKGAEYPYGTYNQYNHSWTIKWGPDPKAAEKAEKEKTAAENAKRAEERRLSEIADAAIERVIDWFLSPVDGASDNGNPIARILARLESLRGVGGKELGANLLRLMLARALYYGDINGSYTNDDICRALVDWLHLHRCIPEDIALSGEELNAIEATMED